MMRSSQYYAGDSGNQEMLGNLGSVIGELVFGGPARQQAREDAELKRRYMQSQIGTNEASTADRQLRTAQRQALIDANSAAFDMMTEGNPNYVAYVDPTRPQEPAPGVDPLAALPVPQKMSPLAQLVSGMNAAQRLAYGNALHAAAANEAINAQDVGSAPLVLGGTIADMMRGATYAGHIPTQDSAFTPEQADDIRQQDYDNELSKARIGADARRYGADRGYEGRVYAADTSAANNRRTTETSAANNAATNATTRGGYSYQHGGSDGKARPGSRPAPAVAASGGYPEGMVIKNPQGVRMVRRGGQWVRL
ncbi:hypothetical protein LZ518_08460 [Sphingomonas sp. RB56-2]|uniref:DNA pilot protein n=1 Tax=Sphingomonas brevis TaxID=2908206 RepID=A0ABT0S9S4_9SPHN|nr:hypothetical protein [Sphingomonas brevis]MCL6741161.1 hypothetical protein [Sphingomonas brevis]